MPSLTAHMYNCQYELLQFFPDKAWITINESVTVKLDGDCIVFEYGMNVHQSNSGSDMDGVYVKLKVIFTSADMEWDWQRHGWWLQES